MVGFYRNNSFYNFLVTVFVPPFFRYKLHVRHYDEDFVEEVKKRLVKFKNRRESTKILLKLIERGIAYHHEGLNAPERGCIEMLFR